MTKRIKATIKMMFLISGSKYTALEINRFCNISDARKVISDLRKSGMQIRDFRNDDGTKTYYLAPDNQLNLWEGNSNGK